MDDSYSKGTPQHTSSPYASKGSYLVAAVVRARPFRPWIRMTLRTPQIITLPAAAARAT